MIVNVDDIDWGSEDARNLRLRTPDQVDIFLGSYVLPAKFKLADFLNGYRYFVFGGKGAGKTALLQYIRIKAEEKLGATASFFYFQSSFSKNDLQAFLTNTAKANDRVVDDSGLSDPEEAFLFWRIFLLAEVAMLLKRAGVAEGPAAEFIKAIEAARLIAKAKNVAKRYPSLQRFSVELSKDAKFQLEGTFESATVSDLSTYLHIAEDKLRGVFLENTPLFLFIDEMEVFIRGDETDALRLGAIAALVRAVRDFNETFRDNDIRVIAAIRDVVVEQVSTVQGEISRIIRDNGVAVDWPLSAKEGFHPLERMVLGRIVMQDAKLKQLRNGDFDSAIAQASKMYFPQDGSLRGSLNLTWYRPRDMALLFDEAATIDSGKGSFSSYTLTDGVVKPLGKRLWEDAISGLAVKYGKQELDGVERLLRGGKDIYSREELLNRMEELSHSYDEVAILSDSHKWMAVIEDLYRAGALYTIAKVSGKKNFAFRGDSMPSLTDDFRVGVHQVLLKHLSIRQGATNDRVYRSPSPRLPRR